MILRDGIGVVAAVPTLPDRYVQLLRKDGHVIVSLGYRKGWRLVESVDNRTADLRAA